MSIPILLALLCGVLAVVGIYATGSYLRLRDFSSCAPPQAESRTSFPYSRADTAVRRSHTVLQTIQAAELAAQNRYAKTPVQVRTWADLQRFHEQMSSRLDAVRRACELRSS